MSKKHKNISNSTFKKIRSFLIERNVNKKDIEKEKTLPGKSKAFTPSITCFHKNFAHDSKNILLVVETFGHEIDNETMHTVALDYFLNFDNLYFVIFYFESTGNYKMIFRIESYNDMDCGFTAEIPVFKDINNY